jgi:hypothetical protein
MVGRPFTRQQIDQNLNIKQRQTILTGDQKHTDHFATGQLISRHDSPTLRVLFFFAAPHFLKTILASRRSGTFGFARHTSQRFAKPKEPFLSTPI